MDLNEYISALNDLAEDENGFLVAKEISDYISDIFDRAEKVQVMMEKYVANDFTVVAFVNITEVTNFDEVEVQLFSSRDENEIKESEKVAFRQFADKYFKQKKSLYNKISSLNLP